MLVGSDLEQEEEEEDISELPEYNLSPNPNTNTKGVMETKL